MLIKQNISFQQQDYTVKLTNATNTTYFYVIVAKCFNKL